jgi:hypothetical protein
MGGVGGSGTRVLAHWLRVLGVNLVPPLNGPLDSLAFTVLFKAPNRFRGPDAGQAMRAAVDAFRWLTTGEGDSTRALATLTRACARIGVSGVPPAGSHRGPWAAGVMVRARAARRFTRGDGPWGWKEPNSHLFIAELAERFPGILYIHTIRNGVDMASSENQQQAENWRQHLEVPVEASGRMAALEYWIRANERATAQMARLGSGKSLLVRYEDLVAEPEGTLLGVARFLRLDPASNALAATAAQIRSASATRRSVGDGLALEQSHREALARYGYRADGDL